MQSAYRRPRIGTEWKIGLICLIVLALSSVHGLLYSFRKYISDSHWWACVVPACWIGALLHTACILFHFINFKDVVA